MDFEKTTFPENSSQKKENFKEFEKEEIKNTFLDSISELNSKGILSDDIKFSFFKYIKSLVNLKNITGIEGKNGNIYLYLKGGEKLEIKYNDLKNFVIKSKLGHLDLKKAEKKVLSLQKAMNAIYNDNNGLLWNDDINDEDIITNDLIEEYDLDPSLKGKNLKDLKKILELESRKLESVYRILGKTDKKKELLKKEIELFAGIGDKFEGGAGYLRLTTNELESMVERLCSSMNTKEIFDYIKNLNKKISDNFKRSDMVVQINLKLMEALYSYTFEKLKNQKAPNKDFIEFAKIITGRGKLKIEDKEKIKYENKTEFDYESLEIADEFKGQILANQVLIYIMYREDDPLINKISKKQKIEINDEELAGKKPIEVINEFKNFFNNSQNSTPDYGEKILNMIGYTNKDFDKPYSELDFMQKVKIGALARLLKEIKNLNTKNITPEKLNILSQELTKEAFDDLNSVLSDNFDASWNDWFGTSAEDLGLKGEEAEIFELYQDINGNGLFDLEDENKPGLGTVALGLSLLAGVVIFGIAIPSVGAAATVSEALIIAAKAGALSGATSSAITQLLSHKGYDDIKEASIDISSQFGIDVALSTIFTMSGLGFLKAKGWNINPDLLFSKQAWTTKAGLVDKSFILSETFTTSYVSSEISNKVKKKYINNHSDTDLENPNEKTNKNAELLEQIKTLYDELNSLTEEGKNN